jgi:hypothetical protein
MYVCVGVLCMYVCMYVCMHYAYMYVMKFIAGATEDTSML